MLFVAIYTIGDNFRALLGPLKKVFYIHGDVELNLGIYLLGAVYLALYPLIRPNKVTSSLFALIATGFLFQALYALLAQAMLVLTGWSQQKLDIDPGIALFIMTLLAGSLFLVLTKREAMWVNLVALLSALLATYQVYAVILGITSQTGS